MLKTCRIKALFLHWNKIMGRGAILLAKAMENNQHLQIFDVSFNSFGSSSIKVGKSLDGYGSFLAKRTIKKDPPAPDLPVAPKKPNAP
jgi:hypothetical protein